MAQITKQKDPSFDPYRDIQQGPSVSIGAGGAVAPAPSTQAPATYVPPAPTLTPPPTTGQQSPVYQTPVPSNLQSIVGDTFQQQPASPIQSTYQDSLLKLIADNQKPVSLEDPQLQPASDVYRATRQREADRARSSAAERAAATGTLGAGGFDANVGQIENRKGMDIAQHDSDLVLNEMNARRQQLTQGLALAQQTGNADAERQIRTQLALLDAAVNESQFGRELQFRESALGSQTQLGQGELSLRLLLGLLQNQLGQGQLGLGYDTLGSNNAFNLANLDFNNLQSVLRGGG